MNLQEEFRADGSELIQVGRDLKCCCPYHGEDTPSCKVETTHFVCFGGSCGAKGDAISYLTWQRYKKFEVEGAEFIQVLKDGCARLHIEFPENKPAAMPVVPKTVYTLEKLKQCCEYQANEHQEKVTFNESTNPDTGAVEFVEVRFDHKTKKRANGKPSKRFLQCAAVAGGFIFGLAGPTPLFNRTRIKESNFIVFVEGFQCAKFLQTLGITATAASGGSNNPVQNVLLEPLRGKTVMIWPDNDTGGAKFADELKIELEKLDCLVSIVSVTELNLQNKDDVVDFCARIEGTNDEKRIAVEAVLDTTKPETLESRIAANINGTRFAIRHPSFMALSSTMCFLPGTITMICSNPGVSKSMLLTQWIWQMYFDGIDCSLLALESGDVFSQERCLAQMAGNNRLLDPEWQRNNVEQVAQAMDAHMPRINELRKNKIIVAPKDSDIVNPQYLVSHIETEAKSGKKVIAIDPVTMMETGDKCWIDQNKFVRDVKRIVRKRQIRLVLITHPKDENGGISQFNMAGGKAFSQNTDTIIWLEAHDTIESCIPCEMNPMESRRMKYNRTMHLLKHRVGPAAKKHIGLFMNGATLMHEEIGFIEA